MNCPSEDWDRYCDEVEQAAEAERLWWVNNGDRVLQVCCAAISKPSHEPLDPDAILKFGELMVRMITDKQADPYE